MKAISEFLRSLVTSSKPKKDSLLNAEDFPLTAEGEKLSRPDGKPIAVAKDAGTAAELVERLNEDEQRKEEDRWSA